MWDSRSASTGRCFSAGSLQVLTGSSADTSPLGSPDYRCGVDGKGLTRLEQVLNSEISAELRGYGSRRSQSRSGRWPPDGFLAVILGRCEASNPESRDSPMCNCTSEVWSCGLSRNDDVRLAGKPRLFSLTGQPFLPRNRLLAGRFRPAMRFATRGPFLQALRTGPVGSGNFPAHRRARFLKTRT